MAEPDEAAVQKRAKELCEQDGRRWDLAEFSPATRGTPIKNPLDEAGRQKYLERARAELRKEAGECLRG
jgi:hypothetical protein